MTDTFEDIAERFDPSQPLHILTFGAQDPFRLSAWRFDPEGDRITGSDYRGFYYIVRLDSVSAVGGKPRDGGSDFVTDDRGFIKTETSDDQD